MSAAGEASFYPERIYRYSPVDLHLKDMIMNSRVWCSSPKDFNDPFDCQLPVATALTQKSAKRWIEDIAAFSGEERKKILRRFQVGEGPLDLKQLERLLNHVVNELRVSDTSLACFSEEQANVLMFAHYGAKHAGVSVGFDFNKMLRLPGGPLQRVRYVDEYPPLNYLKIRRTPAMLDSLFLAKHKAWSYEREWRIVRYEKPRGLQPLPRGVIRSVTFGCLCSPESISDVQLWCKVTNLNIELFFTRPSRTRFELELKHGA